MVDRTSGERFANYKELLSEIRLFTACPELLKPLDDSDEEHRLSCTGSDKEDDRPIRELDEATNDDDLTREDDELARQLDDELSKQLDSQLSNILVGNGSSLYDSESLVSDKFSSVFSSDDEDDFDRIVEQLQSKPSNDEAKTSMPTLSSLLTCPPPSPICVDEPPRPTQTADRPAGRTKSKTTKKKVKFVQHQSKIKTAFSEDESLLNLFNKIIKNNFHQNANSKFNSSSSVCGKPVHLPSSGVSNEPTDKELDSVSMDGSISSISNSVFSGAPRKKRRDARRSNKSHSSKHRSSPKKSKSEIFTLLSSSKTSSPLENLFSSLRSK